MNQEKKRKALIVDSSQTAANGLQKLLKSKGWSAQTTNCPDYAVHLAVNRIFHIAFIDCILPSKSGAELALALRKRLGRSIEIVMMSNIATDDILENFKNMHVLAFLKKPPLLSNVNWILKEAEKKYGSGSKDSLLQTVFSRSFSRDSFLKTLCRMNRESPFQALLALRGGFKSRERLTLSVSLPSGEHCKIFFQNGVMSGFESNKDSLSLQKRLTDTSGSGSGGGGSDGEGLETTLSDWMSSGQISQWQLHNLQTCSFLEFMERLAEAKEVLFQTKLFKTKNCYMQMTEDLFTEKSFPVLKKTLPERFFNETLMSASLEAADPDPQEAPQAPSEREAPQRRSPETRGLTRLLLQNKKLSVSALQNKLSLDESSFQSSVLQALWGGAAFIDFSHDSLLDRFLSERYSKISQFFKTAPAKEVFKQVGNLTSAAANDLEAVKNVPRVFLKFNHTDVFPMNLSPEVKKKIEGAGIELKRLCSAAFLKSHGKKTNETKSKINRELETAQQKKLCSEFLQNKNYKKAFAVIRRVPLDKIKSDSDWMLLYLWIGMKTPLSSPDIDRNFMRELTVAVGAIKASLIRKSLYFYVQGLFFLEENDKKKALMFFRRSKELDNKFQPAFEEYKKTSLQMTKDKTEEGKTEILSLLKIRKFFQKKNALPPAGGQKEKPKRTSEGSGGRLSGKSARQGA